MSSVKGIAHRGHILDKRSGGSSDENIRSLCCKNLRFFENYMCPYRQGRRSWSNADISGTRRTWHFCDFVRKSFIDDP